MAQALNLALDYEMSSDDKVLILGEDVGLNGGVFRITDGLQKKYGENRVIDTPLSENLIGGISVGMSVRGLKPVAEFQFMGFMYSALEQIICHAARMRNRTRGRLSCPIVYRAPFGGGIHAPEHHSESTEVLFAHIPGLRVVIPSSPYKAYGLLLASIRNPDPVIFLEPKRMYRLVKEEFEDDGNSLPLDKSFILREGSDVTIVSFGASMYETRKSAEILKLEYGVSVEIIDVATIKPLDVQPIIQSVKKTGRCVIVHEAAESFGVGAEIAARIAAECFTFLLAPVLRVAGYDSVMPYFKLEKIYIPSTKRIIDNVKKVMEFS